MTFWKSRFIVFLALAGLAFCDQGDDDTSQAFMEAAQALFDNKETIAGLQGAARAFMQSDTGKQMGDMLTGGGGGGGGGGSGGGGQKRGAGLGQLISGLGSLMGGAQGGDGGGGMDLSMLGNIVEGLSAMSGAGQPKQKRATDHSEDKEAQGFDFDSMINIASMFMGQQGNAEGLMGLLPLVLDTFSGSSTKDGHSDHSDHSWFMPPILENAHLMWDHFRNSELGQTLWKNSGLANIMGTMSDENGRIQWEKIMESFGNPSLRRRWISSLTNFVAEWMSHISDPATQQRYLATAQFVGNSFLKSQGYPKSVQFDPTRPTESLSRLANAVAKRHLNMKVDSYQYIKPAVAYIQELMSLASEKGFIMSRINARELSNKLSDSINNGFISPLLKAYRAYKWGSKMPQCAAQILCSINHKSTPTEGKVADESFRTGLTKIASFPAAWAISNRSNLSFWSLYAAILESDNCLDKYPAECMLYHDEEIRATTEYPHSEL